MSWLVRSLANSLNLEESNHSDEEDEKDLHEEGEESHPDTPSRGVKEDLSELSKTLTRQLWGVASFLAPPPQQSSVVDISPSDLSSFHGNDPDAFYYSAPKETDQEINDSETIAGIRSDFAEIGGKFRSGILKLSNAKAVSEITKIASSFLPFGSEEDFDENFTEREAIGVTDEVLAFARNISMHPETWLDFPLFTGDEDSDDFDMSNAQEEHILAIESLAPRLAALRIELCPSHMSEGCFWKIYFVLLHSRLNKHDAELLSTPQIVEARALWLQELQNRRKPEPEKTIRDGDSSCFDEQLSSVPINDFETEKHPVTDLEMNVIDKSIIKEGPSSLDKKIETPSTYIHEYEQEDGDEWLQESGEMGISGVSVIPLGNEEDVSFSDLEEDDVSAPASSSKTLADASDGSSTVDSRGWVQLGKHSSIESTKTVEFPQSQADLELKESSDWLSLDETDV